MKWKNIFLILGLMASLSFDCYSQQLVQGVFTTVTLSRDSAEGFPQPDSCYDYEFNFSQNCFPYVTGMNIYLKIDSINGPINSVQFWRYPDLNYVTVNANDTIQISDTLTTIYTYYLNQATLYTSLIASGIPQILGETYYCDYSHSVQMWWDGCGNLWALFNGGNGALDTSKNCSVVLNNSSSPLSFTNMVSIHPNPTISHFTVTSDNIFINATLEIFNTIGEEVFEQKIQNTSSAEINLRNISSGIYFVKIVDGEKFYSEKLVVQK